MDMDRVVPLAFPLKGLNVATSYGQQPEQTAAVGVNVRAFDADGRGRGGSRAGLSKFLADTVPSGAHLIQHLNIIVDPQSPALLGDLDPTVPDPSSNNLRQRYPANRKYRAGGSAVKPKVVPPTGGPITLIQKKQEQPGNISGPYSLDFDDPVTVGSTIIAVIRTEKAGSTAELVATVRNGGGIDYDQAGGPGYYAEVTDTEYGPTETESLSIWFRPAQEANDKTIIVTPGSHAIYEVMLLEYSGAASVNPVSNQCKGSGSSATFTLPDLNMNGTDGQMVVAAFTKVNTNVTATGTYIGRFGASGATPANTGVVEKKPISGAAPENPAVDAPLARPWCGIAVAVTR